MDHPLDDCRELANGARSKFDALQAEVVKFFEDNATTLTLRSHRQTGHKILDVDRPTTRFPRQWGIEVGRIANDARAALDQMVYAVAFETGGNPEEARTAFPIFEKRDDYLAVKGKGKRRSTVRDVYLAGVPEDPWRKKIDAWQPYHAGDKAYREPLAILADVNNANKHRLQKAACLAIETPEHFVFFVGSDKIGGMRISWQPGAAEIDVKAKITRTRAMDAPGVVVYPKMQVDNRLAVELAFGEPPRGFDLFDVKRFIEVVDEILVEFEPAFIP